MDVNFEQKIKELQYEGVSRVKIAFCDIDGVHRGKYLSLEKFSSVLQSGAGFCDCVLGWDINDQLYDNAKFTGWHTAFPDAKYKIDLSTERRLQDENNIPFYIAYFVKEKDELHDICPRSLLMKVLDKSRRMNIGVNLAFEYEFFIFDETSDSIRAKNYQNLKHLTPGNFGYSLLRANTYSHLFNEFMDFCEHMKFSLEGLHCETGPGVWEAALKYDEALLMSDKAALFKTFTKSFFQKKNLLATFMAKCSMDYPGQSGHVHQSLVNLTDGSSLFYDKKKEYGMSVLMRHYLAGQQKYLSSLLAMYAPTINSYTRLVKGYWAPTAATWGVENRTAALRVIPGSDKSQRIEFRLGSADANPYLVASALIASGLLGIENRMEPTAAIVGNAYEQEDDLPERLQLSSNLFDAIRKFQKSKKAKSVFGKPFCEHYAASRLWEVREYERQVTDWQLRRYLELI
ncbi:MAG: glutamine synthetase [Lentisphaeraceae bacterium]|nr:glutamine synthetase [Lentisphaeraceae bacterium]